MRIGRFILIVLLLVAAATAALLYWPHRPLDPGLRADFVLVDKSDRRLSLLRNGKVLRSYRVALGGSPTGHKLRQGDNRTPEGRYRISGRNPRSTFHLSLRISYPDREDRKRAREKGVPPGGDIMIHGIKNGMGWIGRLHRFTDWTNGCIAVTDVEMREIWRAVPDGTPIEIRA